MFYHFEYLFCLKKKTNVYSDLTQHLLSIKNLCQNNDHLQGIFRNVSYSNKHFFRKRKEQHWFPRPLTEIHFGIGSLKSLVDRIPTYMPWHAVNRFDRSHSQRHLSYHIGGLNFYFVLTRFMFI